MALEPITRQEQIIAGKDLQPITRMERFLKEYGGSGGSGDSVNLPFYVITITSNESMTSFTSKTSYEEATAMLTSGKQVLVFLNVAEESNSFKNALSVGNAFENDTITMSFIMVTNTVYPFNIAWTKDGLEILLE